MVGFFLKNFPEKLIASFLVQFLVYFKTDTVHFAHLLTVCINMQYNSLSQYSEMNNLFVKQERIIVFNYIYMKSDGIGILLK